MVLLLTFLSSRVIAAAFLPNHKGGWTLYFCQEYRLYALHLRRWFLQTRMSWNRRAHQAYSRSIPKENVNYMHGRPMLYEFAIGLKPAEQPVLFFFNKNVSKRDVKAGSINSAAWEGLLSELAFRRVKKKSREERASEKSEKSTDSWGQHG